MHPQNQGKTPVKKVVHQKKASGLLTICLKNVMRSFPFFFIPSSTEPPLQCVFTPNWQSWTAEGFMAIKYLQIPER